MVVFYLLMASIVILLIAYTALYIEISKLKKDFQHTLVETQEFFFDIDKRLKKLEKDK